MKKIIFIFAFLLSLSAQAKVQFFTREGCPFCLKAKEYIISNNFEEKVVFLDITEKENLKLFSKCAKRFDLNEKNLGIPFICAKNDYIMGWNEERQNKLREILSK